MVNLGTQRQKIETLNSADSRALDMIAGSLLRIFARPEETDAELRRHRERLHRLETTAALFGEAERSTVAVAPTSARQYRGNRIPLWDLKDGEDRA